MSARSLKHCLRLLSHGTCVTLLAACTHGGQPGTSVSSFSAGNHESTEVKGEADFYTARAVSKYRVREYAGSMEDVSRAIELSPQQPVAYTTRATVRLQMGDYTGAITDASESLRLNPNQADTYVIRAVAKYNLMDYAGSVYDTTEAIRLSPTNVWA